MAPELLTPEQFAAQLQVSRATIFEWMRKGVVRQGTHYMKFGRVVRFTWSDELISALLADSAVTSDNRQTEQAQTVIRPNKTNKINWDY